MISTAARNWADIAGAAASGKSVRQSRYSIEILPRRTVSRQNAASGLSFAANCVCEAVGTSVPSLVNRSLTDRSAVRVHPRLRRVRTSSMIWIAARNAASMLKFVVSSKCASGA